MRQSVVPVVKHFDFHPCQSSDLELHSTRGDACPARGQLRDQVTHARPKIVFKTTLADIHIILIVTFSLSPSLSTLTPFPPSLPILLNTKYIKCVFDVS